MSAFIAYINDLVNKNKQSFREFNSINWLNPYQAEVYEEKRNNLIQNYSKNINWSFKNTKPWINKISKGCELCGQGEWSCIFITGRCNANCFYCPAPQNNDDLPMAQQLSFKSPENYADFINYFDFKGVSFSGGEPFLVFDRLVEYLEVIRKKCGQDIYIWLYTNGIISKQDKFKKLRDLGLNEVRFDIGADNYHLDHIKKAKNIIENITIEIPLDPNKKELIRQLLPQMQDAGIRNLNLHQLRLTNYNAHRLLKNDYTYLHGEHPTVLESEIAALELLDFADKSNLNLGINYCAFQYKNRFQKAGFRIKVNNKILADESITENGYALSIYGGITDIDLPELISESNLNELLTKNYLKKINQSDLIHENGRYEFLIFDFSGINLYDVKETNVQRMSLMIGSKVYYFQKGKPVRPIKIGKDKINDFIELISNAEYSKIPEDFKLFEIWKYMYIEKEFRPYM